MPPFTTDGDFAYSGFTASAGVTADLGEVARISSAISFGGDLEAKPSEDTEGAGNTVPMPLELRLGGTALLSPQLSLMAGVSWADWSDAGAALASVDGGDVLRVGLAGGCRSGPGGRTGRRPGPDRPLAGAGHPGRRHRNRGLLAFRYLRPGLGLLTPHPPSDSVRVHLHTFGCKANQADAQARRFIRRARRLSPDARIVVAGCSAALRPEDYAGMAGVAGVVKGHDPVAVAAAALGTAARHGQGT